MDPLVDEKLVLTVSASVMDLGSTWLGVNVFREAYGPSVNEGLCYEYCAEVKFDGEISGSLFVGFDGYTKILLLPYIIKKFQMTKPEPEVAEAAILSFVNQLGGMIFEEIREFNLKIDLLPPKDVSHKLIALPQDEYRKYMMIYFIKDEEKKVYLGRLYTIIAIKK